MRENRPVTRTVGQPHALWRTLRHLMVRTILHMLLVYAATVTVQAEPAADLALQFFPQADRVGEFEGDPLAAPYDGYRLQREGDRLRLTTRVLQPGRYRLFYATDPVPDGLFDYEKLDAEHTYGNVELPDIEDPEELRTHLEELPCCAMDDDGEKFGPAPATATPGPRRCRSGRTACLIGCPRYNPECPGRLLRNRPWPAPPTTPPARRKR